MTLRTLLLASTLSLLLAPAAAAHAGHAADDGPAPPFGDCAGLVDVLCFHIDCNELVCARLLCVVYVSHRGHVGDFGCTPP